MIRLARPAHSPSMVEAVQSSVWLAIINVYAKILKWRRRQDEQCIALKATEMLPDHLTRSCH
jgi:hypothetical protein